MSRRQRSEFSFLSFVVALKVSDVIANDGSGIAFAGQLHVKDKLAAGAEHHFGANQVELPHARETDVVHRFYLVTIGLEALRPMGKGFRVMKPQELEIGDPKAVLFDDFEYFR